MSLFCLAVTHRHANARQLASVAEASHHVTDALIAGRVAQVHGHLHLATCNRDELYLDVDDVEAVADTIGDIMAAHLDASLLGLFQRWEQDEAVTHLFEVASGLDSLVLGDDQIAHQLREAVAGPRSDPSGMLHRLVDAALAGSRTVTSTLSPGGTTRSIATVALDLVALDAGTRVVVLGTGSFARVVLAELRRRGVGDITVVSTVGRAQEFAAAHEVSFSDDLASACAAADVLVACSGTTMPPLTAAILADAHCPILDLSLQGNVAAEVLAEGRLRVHRIDELGDRPGCASDALRRQARNILGPQIHRFLELERRRAADPVICALRSHVEQIVADEVALLQANHPSEVSAAAAASLRRLSRRFLHVPTRQAGSHAAEGSLEDYVSALQHVFGIEV